MTDSDRRIAEAPRAWFVRSKGYLSGYNKSDLFRSRDEAEEYARDYGGCVVPVALVELKPEEVG
jgi:nitrous oxide reductase accessory protein NosL